MTPWTVTPQAPLSMGFPKKEYWSGLPFPSLGDLVGPGIEPGSPALAGRFFTTESSGKFILGGYTVQITLWGHSSNLSLDFLSLAELLESEQHICRPELGQRCGQTELGDCYLLPSEAPSFPPVASVAPAQYCDCPPA